MLTWVESQYLSGLALNDSFVNTLHEKQPDDTSSYVTLLDAVTDRFHDHYHLDSDQRRRVRYALSMRSQTIHELCSFYENTIEATMLSEEETSAPGPMGPAPARTAHGVETLTGPYPIDASSDRRGRSPSARSIDIDDHSVLNVDLNEAFGNLLQGSRARADSAPPVLT